MKILVAVMLSLLLFIGLTLAYSLARQDSLPAQARRLLAKDPRFARVTVTIVFDDIVVLEGRTRTVEESWDARNWLWTAWQGTPRPAGVLNHITADTPAWAPPGSIFVRPDEAVIPKIVFKNGRPCTTGGALMSHSPLMVIPSCDER